VLKDRILTSPNFTLLFTDYEGIDAYQFVQKKIDEVEVKIVRNLKFTAEVEAYLKNSLSHLMGSQTRFWLSYPDTIEIPKSGKRRYIISEVPETSHEAPGA
jgi:phenylacetate-CoA ligase